MGSSKSGNLLTLLWASTTLATPLLSESLFGRQASNCPKSYTSYNGLNFTIDCDQNNPFNDALEPFKVDTLEECLERCSRFWGNGEGCYGVVYTSAEDCWIRNSTTSRLSGNRTVYAKALVEEEGTISALVDRNQMQPLDTDCPAPDLSRHTLDGAPGVEYTVQCNRDIGGAYDTCWQGYHGCHNNPFQAFYHATSLEHCLQFCIKEHPLCQGVVYNPGLEIGYANCWPKTNFPPTLSSTSRALNIAHSATLTTIDTPDTDCDRNETYTSTNDDSKHFAIHCGQTNQGTNMTTVHAQNLTSCMEECAKNTNDCKGVVFDTSLRQGFENCYLQNTSSVFSDVGSSIYAVLTSERPEESGGPGSDGNNNGDSDSGSESKAWIAGAVIGPIAGLALIGAAFWFFRRRKTSGAAAGGVHETDSAAKHNPYAPSSPAPAYAPVPQHSPPRHNMSPSELDGGDNHQMSEMEAGSAAKYAHNGSPAQRVHELQ